MLHKATRGVSKALYFGLGKNPHIVFILGVLGRFEAVFYVVIIEQ